jgi:hypothetical protein
LSFYKSFLLDVTSSVLIWWNNFLLEYRLANHLKIGCSSSFFYLFFCELIRPKRSLSFCFDEISVLSELMKWILSSLIWIKFFYDEEDNLIESKRTLVFQLFIIVKKIVFSLRVVLTKKMLWWMNKNPRHYNSLNHWICCSHTIVLLSHKYVNPKMRESKKIVVNQKNQKYRIIQSSNLLLNPRKEREKNNNPMNEWS